MNILVVGGAGYIGSHVVRQFLDQGHQVHVFDNFYSGPRENLQAEAGFSHGDILLSDRLRAVMRQFGPFDGLVHLAAYKAVGESMLQPEKYSVNNLSGTINILNAMVEAGIRYLVFSSSAAVYGEPQYLPVDERHPTSPQNYYGFTKLEIENILAWYAQLKGLRFAALRYFNAAGHDPAGRVLGLERNPANLLPIIMEVAAGWRPHLEIFGTDYDTPDGTGIRDYIHVTDLARAHVQSLAWLVANNQNLTVNLGSEQGLSVKEILSAARRITGRPIAAQDSPRRPGDPARLVASSQLATKLLDWQAQRSDVESLVASSWQAYRRVAKL